MPREIEIRVPGAVNAYNSWGGGSSKDPFMVGAPPQWNDDSDDTYAELETFEHPDVSYVDEARGVLERGIDVTTDATKVSVVARVRYQCLAVDMHIPTATVYSSLNTGSLLFAGGTSIPGSLTPAWVDLPLSESQPGRMAAFLARVNDTAGELTLRVRPDTLRHYSFRYPRTRIFEAFLVVITPGRDAPPCRLFPRDDGLGVGSGRRFPPPTSQQRGHRWVGYY